MLSLNNSSRSHISLAVVMIAVGLGGILGLALSKFPPIYVVAGEIALVGALIIIANVEIGLLVLVVVTYTRLSDVLVHTYSAPSIAKPLIALLVVAIAIQWIFRTGPPRDWGKAALLVSFYGMIIFTSLFYSASFESANAALNDFWKDGMIAVIIVILARNVSILRRVIWMLIGVGMFLGSISVYQYLTGSFDNNYWGFGEAAIQNIAGSSSGYRIAGPIGDPNFYSQIMLVIVPISFVRFLDEKNTILRGLALYAVGVSLLTVFFSFSRGAFLALVLMGFIYFFINRPKPNQLVFMMLIGVIVFRFIPAEYTDRLLTLPALFSGTTQGVTSDISFQGRASELTAAWMMFADHPVFGVGASNYPVYYQQYSRRIGLDPRTEARQAHNLYLEVAAEMGLAGLIAFFTLLWNVFNGVWNSWRQLKESGERVHANMILSIAISLVGYFSAAVFIHAAYPRYLWLLVGIALSIPQMTNSVLNPDGEKNV
jgi:putative inorganic carbon (hco3(-)) transporter